jgi:hypothetical protein
MNSNHSKPWSTSIKSEYIRPLDSSQLLLNSVAPQVVMPKWLDRFPDLFTGALQWCVCYT